MRNASATSKQMSYRFRTRTFVALSLAIAACIPAGLAMAAAPDSTDISANMRYALQRDLGVMPGQVANYLSAEKAAAQAQHNARTTLGDSFAGTWIERNRLGQYEVVVATNQQSRLAAARGLKAQARLVQYSLSALESTIARLNASARATASTGVRAGQASAANGAVDPRIHSWHIDLRTNRVVITTDRGAEDAAKALMTASGADARMIVFKTSDARPQPTEDIRSADRYSMPNGSCSVGFAVARGGETGFATAGHCGVAGTLAWTGPSNYYVGSVIASQFPGADIAWVRNDYPFYWAVQPWTNLYNGSNLNVVGNLEAPIGGAVCRSGGTTGWRCGAMVAKNATVNTTGGLVYGLHESSACGGFGDSGGPFFTTGGEAQGVYSAANIPQGSNDNCSVSTRSWHQPIQPLLNAYGLTLQTVETCGRMNPGRVLPNGGSVTSCDGRFTFVIQSDGHLVLYQAGVGPIWWNNVFGSGHVLAMQTDGHLVVYNSANQPVWYTGTNGNNGAMLFVQNDGNVVIYNHLSQPLWWTGTNGR
jgi:hypothetical protein